MFRLVLFRLVLVLLAFCAGPQLVGAQRLPPNELATSLQRRYQLIRDFSAEFVQTYRGGVLRTQTAERGTVAIKKPGMMRWLYTNPERKEFVSDGRKIYFYTPQDKQVQVMNVPAANDATTPALFLAGRGDVARDFMASYIDPAPQGTLALKLTPRRSEPDYEYLIVAVDPTSLQIRSLTTRDHQGGDSTLTFSKLKENIGLADKDFAFRIPRGVNVITE